VLAEGIRIQRPHKSWGRYTMIRHMKRAQAQKVHDMLRISNRKYHNDGYSQWMRNYNTAANENLTSTRYVIRRLYYHLRVNVGIPPVEWYDVVTHESGVCCFWGDWSVRFVGVILHFGLLLYY
jgi:hypothetical protein